jgi:hypothetical protein
VIPRFTLLTFLLILTWFVVLGIWIWASTWTTHTLAYIAALGVLGVGLRIDRR